MVTNVLKIYFLLSCFIMSSFSKLSIYDPATSLGLPNSSMIF